VTHEIDCIEMDIDESLNNISPLLFIGISALSEKKLELAIV